MHALIQQTSNIKNQALKKDILNFIKNSNIVSIIDPYTEDAKTYIKEIEKILKKHPGNEPEFANTLALLKNIQNISEEYKENIIYEVFHDQIETNNNFSEIESLKIFFSEEDIGPLGTLPEKAEEVKEGSFSQTLQSKQELKKYLKLLPPNSKEKKKFSSQTKFKKSQAAKN
jgi:hypothetical protein